MDGLSDRGSIPLSSTWQFCLTGPVIRGLLSLKNKHTGFEMKRFIATFLLFISVFALTGCANIFNAGNNGPTAAPALGDDPTQSANAQKLLQFRQPAAGETVAEIEVEGYGSIYVKFFEKLAPKAVENFVTHAKQGYYDGVKFHRVIADFMIQGGDPTGTGRGGESIYGEPFEDEFSPELEPMRGALCMANAGANTNGSQFFIVSETAAKVQELKKYVEYKGYTFKDYLKAGYNTELSDEQIEKFLLYGGAPWLSGHHTVFGQVYKGFDVLDRISVADTDNKDIPLKPIVIKTIKITEYTAPAE